MAGQMQRAERLRLRQEQLLQAEHKPRQVQQAAQHHSQLQVQGTLLVEQPHSLVVEHRGSLQAELQRTLVAEFQGMLAFRAAGP